MNNILVFITQIERKFKIAFKPTREFYKSLGIGQRRWSLLLKNEKQPDLKELESLASYFECKPEDLYSLHTK